MKLIYTHACLFRSLAAATVVLLPLSRGMATEWGRSLPTDRDDVPALTVGLVSDVQNSIEKGGAHVSTEDLAIGASGWGIGFSDEYWGWLVSLRYELLITSLSEKETAHKDLYLKPADKVQFDGQSYNYMRIPKGTPYENEFTGGWLDLNAMIHPVTFGGPDNSFTPLIEVGFIAMGGTADLNAGDPSSASGNFVTGGDSSGYTDSFTPQLGGGLDWRIGAESEINHVLQLHALVGLPGATEADHLNIKASYHVLFPMEGYENTFLAGLDYRNVSTELEDGDEQSTFTMSSIMLVLGMTY
jgi:hypothetical protein